MTEARRFAQWNRDNGNGLPGGRRLARLRRSRLRGPSPGLLRLARVGGWPGTDAQTRVMLASATDDHCPSSEVDRVTM